MELKKRNSGIELLRIISMISIMVLHIMGQGGVIENLSVGGPQYFTAWALEIICFFGVTTYGIISGFVGVDAHYRVTNIIYTWLQVFFYTIIITTLFYFFVPEVVHGSAFLSACFPVFTEQYWYFSAYFGVFFLMPVLNFAIKNMDRRMINITFGFFLTAFSVCPVIFSTDIFALREGYSFGWLLAAYFFGAYAKKFDIFKKIKSINLLLIFCLATALTYAFKVVCDLVIGKGGDRLVQYNSPTVLLASLALVCLFSRIDIKNKMGKLILAAGPLTFGVYLINCQPLVWKYLMKDRFISYADLNPALMVIRVLLVALEIFFIGIAVDALRRLLFEVIGLRRRLNSLNDMIMRRKCPCCGMGRVDKFEICEVCGWENDPVQAKDPGFRGGANKESLNEYRAKYLEGINSESANEDKDI
ncbi:MAG: acyltransferase family protein [Lachnospiraceae bacterium]|nr:acyltransferase family protein [Lachnospiraceae bacterium]